MKKIFTLLLFVGAFSLYGKAQNDDDGLDRIESYKIAFITEKLNLTSKEAAVFWPVYNEYSDKISTLRKREHDRVKRFNKIGNPSDKESDSFIKEYLSYKQQQRVMIEKYMIDFKKVLPVTKVAKLITIEQEFKMQLLQRYKEKRG
jgi:hypothetical protein